VVRAVNTASKSRRIASARDKRDGDCAAIQASIRLLNRHKAHGLWRHRGAAAYAVERGGALLVGELGFKDLIGNRGQLLPAGGLGRIDSARALPISWRRKAGIWL